MGRSLAAISAVSFYSTRSSGSKVDTKKIIIKTLSGGVANGQLNLESSEQLSRR
jgi:hypothetical protein